MSLIEQGRGWKAQAGQIPYSEDLDDSFIATLRAAMRTGAAPSMISRIQEAVAQAEAVQHHRRALRLECLLAQAYEAARKRSEALEVLERVLHVACTKGLLRTLADEPWHLAPLLDVMPPDAGVGDAHLAALRAALEMRADTVAPVNMPGGIDEMLASANGRSYGCWQAAFRTRN